MTTIDLFYVPAGSKDPEYRSHIIQAWREDDHWVGHWGLPDHSTPDYRLPDPYPKTRYGGGFLKGPYESEKEALAAARAAVDWNLEPREPS